MCFDQKTSFGFAGIGLGLCWYIHHYTENTRLAVGVFWFFLMEFLQGFQYFWIDDCENSINQALTLVGYFHICYQPYFTHIINSALTKNPKFKDQYQIILRMCLLTGTIMMSRYFLAPFAQEIISSDYGVWKGLTPLPGSHRTPEWLRGEELCTYKGNYHLAWSVPMYDATYWMPSAAIHSVMMFGPFFVMKRNMIIQGVFLWLAGPFLASYITSNLQEQASIWCFASIAQIGIMLFIIREQLILSWGRDRKTRVSLHDKEQASTKNGKTPVPNVASGKKRAVSKKVQ